MLEFIKNKFDPKNCDDDTLIARTLRSDKGISFGAALVLGSAITGFCALLAGVTAVAGAVPWIVPALIAGAAISAFGVGFTVGGFFNSLHMNLDDECKRRHICPPGPHYHKHQYIPYVAPAAPAVAAPVLAEIFDPAAAVTLGESVRVMPSIKLKQQRPAA